MDNLKTLMGDAYQEGVTTVEDINNFFSNGKYADLSTGAYVDKNKYEAGINAKQGEIDRLKAELQAKMTDDEKAQNTANEKDEMIKQLQEQIALANKVNASVGAKGCLSEAMVTLGIKDDDKEFSALVGALSNGDLENAKTNATYINKLVSDAYKKGQKDATRDGLGNFSKDIATSSSADGGKKISLGKQLAQKSNSVKVDTEMYFKEK